MGDIIHLVEINSQLGFSDFSTFRDHVTSKLQSRTQRVADPNRLSRPYRTAAVLFALIVPSDIEIVENPLQHIYLLLGKRSNKMKNHPGDIAFPGGVHDESDKDTIETAYREAREELGVETHRLEFIAYMDEFIASSNILVRPVISWYHSVLDHSILQEQLSQELNPKTEETIATLIIPLVHFLNPQNYSSTPYLRNNLVSGYIRYFDVDQYLQGDRIWGLTASMIRRFIDIIFPEHSLPEEPLQKKH